MPGDSVSALAKTVNALNEQLDAHIYLLAVTILKIEQHAPDLRSEIIDVLDRMLEGSDPSPEKTARIVPVERLRSLLQEQGIPMLH